MAVMLSIATFTWNEVPWKRCDLIPMWLSLTKTFSINKMFVGGSTGFSTLVSVLWSDLGIIGWYGSLYLYTECQSYIYQIFFSFLVKLGLKWLLKSYGWTSG